MDSKEIKTIRISRVLGGILVRLIMRNVRIIVVVDVVARIVRILVQFHWR